MRELAERQVPIEVCYTSELQTGALEHLGAHAIGTLLEAGCKVVVCSDNNSVSNTWVGHELMLLSEMLGLGDAEVDRLLGNAVEASFADDATKARLRATIAG